MTTHDAFQDLTSKRGWYKAIGITEKAASSAKTAFKNGKITLDKMEEVLSKAGYKVLTEKTWKPNEL